MQQNLNQRRPTLPPFFLTDEDDIYTLNGNAIADPDYLELRAGDLFPPSASLLYLGGTTTEVVTTDGAGAQKGSFYARAYAASSSLDYPMAPLSPVVLKKYPSLLIGTSGTAPGIITFAVLSDYYNKAQIKWGASAVTGGSGVYIVSSKLSALTFTRTGAGSDSYADIYKIDLGADTSIARIGCLAVLTTTNGFAYFRIGYGTEAGVYTYGSDTSVSYPSTAQVFPAAMDGVTARYIVAQAKNSNTNNTLSATLLWLNAWVAK